MALTAPTDRPQNPIISPERGSIIYLQGTADGANKLMAMAADGTAPVEVLRTRPAGCKSVGRPAWNPVNTQQLALACTGSAGTSTVQLVRLDGTEWFR